MKYVLLVLTLISLAAAPAIAGVPDDLQKVSVTIKAGNAQGSGTLVTRKIGEDTVTFIWTAAHVVDGLRTTRTVVTPQGTPRILVEYKDAEIVQERQQDGRRVGEVKYDCKVIKVSDADYGEDLAVLMVRCKGAYPANVCAKFHKDPNYIPPIGVDLSHCGSLLGQFGANSYTTGVLSQTGRTLPMKGANVRVFDQVTTVSFPGSSGGGMYPEGERRVHRHVDPGGDAVARLQLHRSGAAHPRLGQGVEGRVGHRPHGPIAQLEGNRRDPRGGRRPVAGWVSATQSGRRPRRGWPAGLQAARSTSTTPSTGSRRSRSTARG